MKQQHTLTFAALTLVAMGGIAQGWMTHRWTANAAVADAVSLLADVPSQVGDWTATDQVMTENEIEIGRIDGYVKREYVNGMTGARVYFLLMCGEAGPIALHPPTVCFSGQGYHVVGHQAHASIHDETHDGQTYDYDFHQADFGNSAIDDPALTRLYWAWSTDGQWESTVNPRVKYAGEASLFKLYVSEQWVPSGTVSDTGIAKLFMEEMLPAVRSALQPRNSQREK